MKPVHALCFVGLLYIGCDAKLRPGGGDAADLREELPNQNGTSTLIAVNGLTTDARQDVIEYRFDLSIDGALRSKVSAVVARDGTSVRVTSHGSKDDYTVKVTQTAGVQGIDSAYVVDGVERHLYAATMSPQDFPPLSSMLVNDHVRELAAPLIDQGAHRELLSALRLIGRREDPTLRALVESGLSSSGALEKLSTGPGADEPSMQEGVARFVRKANAKPALPLDSCYGDCSMDHRSMFNQESTVTLAGVPGIVEIMASGPKVSGTSKCFGTCEVTKAQSGGGVTETNTAIANSWCAATGYGAAQGYTNQDQIKGDIGATASNPTGCVSDGVIDNATVAEFKMWIWSVLVVDVAAGANNCNLAKDIKASIEINQYSCYGNTTFGKKGVAIGKFWTFSGGCSGQQGVPCTE